MMPSKILIKRFSRCPTDKWEDMVYWCEQNLSIPTRYTRTWHHRYPEFYFVNEQEYAVFLLRWL